MRERDNIFDGMLVVMMSLIVFGLIGNALQPIRLFIMALAPFMVIDTIRTPEKNVSYFYGYECFFFIIWWLYAAAFLFKAADVVESAKQLIYLLIHMLGFLEVLWLSLHAHNPQRSVAKGWICMLALSLPVAFYELSTDFHLPMSLQDTGESINYNGISIERRFASVTFGNLNSYNTVLCWAVPFLFLWNLYPQKKKDRLIGVTLLLLTVFVVIANSSRGAIICLGVLFLVYSYCYFRIGRNRILLVIAYAVVIGVFAYYLLDIFLLITERFSAQGLGDDGRSENIVQGTQAFLESYGLGIGIGNYEPIMAQVFRVEYAAPHNLSLEVFVLYGIFIFIGYLGMLLRLILLARRGTQYNRFAFFFCAVSFVFAGIIDSQYLMKAPTWMFLASLYVFFDEQYNQPKATC